MLDRATAFTLLYVLCFNAISFHLTAYLDKLQFLESITDTLCIMLSLIDKNEMFNRKCK